MFRFDKEKDHWVLWEDETIYVVVQRKTNFPARYGGHIVVGQKAGVKTPYENLGLFSDMMKMAAIVQKALETLHIAPHANIQSNANWAFRRMDGSFRDVLSGREKRLLHIHIYGRCPDDPNWGEPVRPAYHREQQRDGKYWNMIWPKKTLKKISDFIAKEIVI